MRASFALQCLVLGIAITSPGAMPRAGEGVPLLHPQWIATMAQDALADDRIAPSSDPSAVRLADGGEVAITVATGEIVLRRYAADGSVLRTQTVAVADYSVDVVLRATATHDAFYVLVGGAQSGAQLLRLDADLQPLWSRSLAFESICQREGDCLRLEVLEDGSVLAMRAFHLVRFGADGALRWSFDAAANGGSFRGGDLAVDGTTIWFATSGGVDFYNPTATLSRLDIDGVPLSSDVSSCQGCGGVVLADIALSSDGAAQVVGDRGGRGFLARYNALGYPTFWAASDDPRSYRRLDRDDTGAVYVLAEDMFDGDVVKHIDAATGATLWSVPANDFIARAVGVVAIRKTAATIEASGIDANGTVSWSQPLSASNGGSQRVWSRPARDGGDVELLVADFAPSDDPCARHPRLVRMDDSGALNRFPPPCRARTSAVTVANIDARIDTGALVNTFGRLALFSPNGDLRWQVDACVWCTNYWSASLWPVAALADDGGAWALRWDRPSLALPDGRARVQRFDVGGAFAFDVTSAAAAADNTEFHLLPGPDDVVVLRGGVRRVVTWQRIGNDGTDLGANSYAIPDDDYRIEDARRLPDGGASVLAKGNGYCSVGCPPFYLTVLRLASDGTLVWRYQFPETYAPWISAALGADGGAVAVLPPSGVDGSSRLSMRTIDRFGHASADISLTEIDADVQPAVLVTALNEHWLLSTESYAGEQVDWLLDANGHVSVQRRNGPYSWFFQTSAVGYLANEPISADVENVLLLDPQTLADRARFYNGTGTGIVDSRRWRVLDDGSVYGTIILPQSGSFQTIARYSAPGGTLSDVIFRNGLD